MRAWTGEGMTQQKGESEIPQATVGRILFLCSGNYFRSRFAEELFNHCCSTGGPIRAA